MYTITHLHQPAQFTHRYTFFFFSLKKFFEIKEKKNKNEDELASSCIYITWCADFANIIRLACYSIEEENTLWYCMHTRARLAKNLVFTSKHNTYICLCNRNITPTGWSVIGKEKKQQTIRTLWSFNFELRERVVESKNDQGVKIRKRIRRRGKKKVINKFFFYLISR